MHHPACWVKHGGCATPKEHTGSAVALAYRNSPALGGDPPHPAEGTRVRVPPLAALPDDEPETGDAGGPAREPVPIAPRIAQGQPPAVATGALPSAAVRAGATKEQSAGRPGLPYNPEPTHPPEPRRRDHGSPAGHMKPLPKVYGHHRLLAYWYIPAAVALALLVAFGIIKAVDWIAGGDDSDSQGAGSTVPATGATPGAATTTTPAAGATVSSTTTATPGSGSSRKFKLGDAVVVIGTGDCLNVRVAAGRSNDAIICLADGEQVTITGGPEAKDNLEWWKVKTTSGEGWAAEDYLAKRP